MDGLLKILDWISSMVNAKINFEELVTTIVYDMNFYVFVLHLTNFKT
jgi:hypothetical protein